MLLMFADRAAEAEVVGVDQLVAELDFFAFQADVGDPMLAAGIRAAGDMQFKLLIETRDANFEFFDQPAGETFRFGDRQFAEFRRRCRRWLRARRARRLRQARRVQSIRERAGYWRLAR